MSAPPPLPPSNPTARKPVPLARGFSCTACGAAVKLLTGGVALSAACGNCGTAVDVTDPNLRVLAQWKERLGQIKPVIPIGARGVLEDIPWQCIGFMQRRERSSGWSWDEHLLFNPYHGFRWLVHDHGHWSYVTMIKDRPVVHACGGVSFRGLSFRRWAQATVLVTSVLGEFYWLLEKNETVDAVDYVSPPYMLSRETYPGGSELIYSLGKYVEPQVVRDAFGLASVPHQQDVGAAQPNPWKQRSSAAWKWLMFAMMILLAAQIGAVVLASKAPAMKESFTYAEQQGERSFASQPFTLDGWTRGVSVKTVSQISGGSLDLRMRLVNEDTQRAYPLGQTVARFSGWTDDQTSAESSLSGIPDGKYRLVVEPGNFTSTDPEKVSTFASADAVGTPAPAPPVPLTFQVARMVDWSPFKLCAFLMVVPALVAGFFSMSFESRRWKNSDETG